MTWKRRSLTWAACGGLALLTTALPGRAQVAGGGGTGGGGTAGAGGGGTGGNAVGGGGLNTDTSGLVGPQGASGTLGTGNLSTLNPTATTTGSLTTVPSSANPFGPSYNSPLGIGLPANFNTTPVTGNFGNRTAGKGGSFGQPLYGKTTANAGAAGFGTAGTAGLGTTGTAAGGAGTGFTTVGVRRAPQYTTGLSEDLPTIAHPPARLRQDVQAVVARSAAVRSRDTVAVEVAGGTVVLRGQVASPRERRLVEAMIRLTPGVRDVQNELQVIETAPPPTPVP